METSITLTFDTPEEAAVIVSIFEEIKHAKLKHPNWPDDAVSRAAIVSEEAGEVIREANHIREGYGDERLLRNELIQTAGTCIRMLNVMDDDHRATERVFHEPGEKHKGLGIFALFNHFSDRCFHSETLVLPYNEHHH